MRYFPFQFTELYLLLFWCSTCGHWPDFMSISAGRCRCRGSLFDLLIRVYDVCLEQTRQMIDTHVEFTAFLKLITVVVSKCRSLWELTLLTYAGPGKKLYSALAGPSHYWLQAAVGASGLAGSCSKWRVIRAGMHSRNHPALSNLHNPEFDGALGRINLLLVN